MGSHEVVLEALARMTGREVRSLTPTTRIAEDLGMRPLDRIDLLSLLEDRLGVTLSDREVMLAKTVGDLAAIAAALRHEPSLHEDVAERWGADFLQLVVHPQGGFVELDEPP